MSTAKKRGMGADKDFACIRGAIFNVIQQALAEGVGVATLAVDQRDYGATICVRKRVNQDEKL